MEKEEKMRKKKSKEKSIRVISNVIVGCMGIIFLAIMCVLLITPEFRITQNGTEVNNFTACCIELKSIDYFENYSSLLNYSRTKTYGDMENIEIYIPEEENILGFDCKIIEKKDLNKKWLDENLRCIEKYNKEINSLCIESITGDCSMFDYSKCLKYQFGDYEIEKN